MTAVAVNTCFTTDSSCLPHFVYFSQFYLTLQILSINQILSGYLIFLISIPFPSPSSFFLSLFSHFPFLPHLSSFFIPLYFVILHSLFYFSLLEIQFITLSLMFNLSVYSILPVTDFYLWLIELKRSLVMIFIAYVDIQFALKLPW